MPRRSILSAAERDSLVALPDTRDGVIRHYTLSESDLAIIHQRRGGANRLGFAVLLSYMRYPGVILSGDETPFPPLLKLVATQLKVDEACWGDYGQRDQTRRRIQIQLFWPSCACLRRRPWPMMLWLPQKGHRRGSCCSGGGVTPGRSCFRRRVVR